jgi:hypothetical protein
VRVELRVAVDEDVGCAGGVGDRRGEADGEEGEAVAADGGVVAVGGGGGVEFGAGAAEEEEEDGPLWDEGVSAAC